MRGTRGPSHTDRDLPGTAEGDHNVVALHEQIADVIPEREAIVDGTRRFTWSDMSDRSRRLASVLRSAGIGLRSDPTEVPAWESPHDHVALYLYNGHEYLEGMFGAWKARAAAVNINYRYVAAELAYVLRDSSAKAVIVDERFASTLAEVLPDLPEILLVLQVGDGAHEDLLPGARSYEEALQAGLPEEPDGLSPDDRYIVYTGGTTGRPKGVLWRQGDFLATCLGVTGSADALVAAAGEEGRADLRVLPSAPLMHGAALWNAISALTSGGTVVIPGDPTRLDPADVLASCERERVAGLQIVGDAFARPLLDELRRGTYDLTALRSLVSGGAIFSRPLKQAWRDQLPGLRIVDVLGSSETGRQARNDAGAPSFSPVDETVVLGADRSRLLAPGEDEIGWLAQRGRVPLGYLGDPDKTRATFPVIDGDRYAVAGDRVRLSTDGQVELLGRDSAVINTGGEKVYAEEVEQVLTSHPRVADALVVGRPSERWGQEVAAVVMPVAEAAATGAVASLPTEQQLRDHCRTSLAGYKIPKTVLWVEQVRRSPSGKPDYDWARQVVADYQDTP